MIIRNLNLISDSKKILF